MKAEKWRDLSDDEIRQKARELSEEIFNLRFQLSMGVAKNPSRVGEARRDLARAHTILGERGQGGTLPATTPATPAVVAAPEKKPRRRAPAAAGRKKAPAKRATTTARKTVRATKKTG